MDEPHFADVGDDGEAEGRMDLEAGGPIDEQGAADEIIAGDDAHAVFPAVAETGVIPEAGVVAGQAVVAQDEEFIGVEGEGAAFGAPSRMPGAVGGIGVVDVPVKSQVPDGEISLLAHQRHGGNRSGFQEVMGGELFVQEARQVVVGKLPAEFFLIALFQLPEGEVLGKLLNNEVFFLVKRGEPMGGIRGEEAPSGLAVQGDLPA